MDNFVDQIRFALQVAWDNARFEASGRVIPAAAIFVAVLILLWLFGSAGVRRKG